MYYVYSINIVWYLNIPILRFIGSKCKYFGTTKLRNILSIARTSVKVDFWIGRVRF